MTTDSTSSSAMDMRGTLLGRRGPALLYPKPRPRATASFAPGHSGELPGIPGDPEDLRIGEEFDGGSEFVLDRADDPVGDEPLGHGAGVDAVGEDEVMVVVADGRQVDRGGGEAHRGSELA